MGCHRTRRGAAIIVALATTLIATIDPASAAGAGSLVRSLLIPGWGQYSDGHPVSASRFLLTEGVLWASFFGMQALSDIRAETGRTYASEHAEADTRGKGDVFLNDLGFYRSQHQHNQFARVDDGADAQLYPNTAEFRWEWDLDASRRRYRKLRNSAETAHQQSLFATGLVIVNHLVAAIHAGRESPPAAPALSWHWLVGPDRVSLNLRRSL